MLIIQDLAFEGLALKKIGVTKLNFLRKVFRLEVFYYANKEEYTNVAILSVLRICRHKPF